MNERDAWPLTDGTQRLADVIKAVVAHYAGVHLDLFQRLIVSTASLSVIRFAPDRPFLLLFNDTGAVPPAPKPVEDATQEQGEG